MNLSGKSAVVTGGGNGIGRAICLALAGEGVNVAVADIEGEAARGVADEAAALGVQAIGVATDLTGEASVAALADAAWEAFGSVEILVNNAGVAQNSMPLAQTSAQDLDWIFAVNVGGAMNGVRVFAPRFLASGGPCHIVNTASEHALGVPHLGGGLYTASKHALLGLSDVLRRDLPDHVKVSVLCPGIVESTLWRASERRQETFGGASPAPEMAGAFMSQIGMPAEEVAAAAVEGIRQGRFFIVTHPHAVRFAQSRWEEIGQAFAEQAPRREGDEQYDLEPIMQRILAGRNPSDE